MSVCLSLTGLSPSLAGFPKTFLLDSQNQLCGPNPVMHARPFGLFPFRSPLLWKSNFSFSSSGYLDVSVHRVPFHTLWIGVWIHEVFSCGFPHSDICGSRNICFSPQLFAAYHVFLRLLVPRHPPCALFCLTSFASVSIALETGSSRFSTLYQLLTLIFGLLQTYVCVLGCLDKNLFINLCMKFSRYKSHFVLRTHALEVTL